MKSAILVLSLLNIYPLMTACAAKTWLTIEGTQGIGKGQHIVFVTGEGYYRSEEGMAMFAQILAGRHG